MRETPLHDAHVALGARMVEFGGWHMPVQYGPILDEARTVRERAGLFDLGHMGRVDVRGPDAVRYLDHLVSNHVAKIPLGSIRYAILCRPDGTPIDDLLVYRDVRSVYLVVNASNTEADLAWMRAHTKGFQVEIDDQTARTTMIALQGPASTAVMQKLVEGAELSKLGYYRFLRARVCGIPDVMVSRTGYTGEVGYEIYFENDQAERVWGAVLAAGKGEGVTPIGLGARDTLRLEAGMALYGHELDPHHDPVEAGLDFALSFDEAKGDWIGRGALLARKQDLRRKLVGLITSGKRVPRQGYPLFDGETQVGEVCSGAVSPTLDTNIGTAFVQLDHARPGVELEMDLRGKRQGVTLCELPFYSRTRKAKA